MFMHSDVLFAPLRPLPSVSSKKEFSAAGVKPLSVDYQPKLGLLQFIGSSSSLRGMIFVPYPYIATPG